jgi:hypothetical protein
MYELRFAPQPTDLRPAPQVADLLPAVTLTPHAGEELDSYASEEEHLLFDAWAQVVDAGEPPF